MQTDAFVSDHMKIFTVDSFSMGMGNMAGSLHAIDEEVQEAAVTREISTICHAMRDVGHHVMQCRIFRISDEWFASVMLNVNLWKPYRFYYFNQDSGKLVLLYVFDGEDEEFCPRKDCTRLISPVSADGLIPSLRTV